MGELFTVIEDIDGVTLSRRNTDGAYIVETETTIDCLDSLDKAYALFWTILE